MVRSSALALPVLISLAIGQAGAAEIEWSHDTFSHYFKDAKVGEAISSLAATENIPVVFEEEIDERISARFSEVAPGKVFRQLMRAYNLQWFYDGHALYVERVASGKRVNIELKSVPVSQFEDRLKRLGLLDERFYWRAVPEEGLVIVGGPRQFIRRVQELASVFDRDGRTFDTVYRWKDADGQMHFSTDPTSVPEWARKVRYRRRAEDDKEVVNRRQPAASREMERKPAKGAVSVINDQLEELAATDE